MERPPLWLVALAVPGEQEVSLLAELSRRRDCRVVGVVDPTGEAIGTTIAEVMGIPVHAAADAEPLRQAHYLIHPAVCPGLDRLIAAADRLGLVPVSSQDFQRLLEPPPPTVQTARPLPPHSDRLERETETIHRTLSRIEEVLHRESLLRWLLSLATRAVGASTGSIMLHDEKSEELYIAFAHGLSEATIHATRLARGQGIAGRVAERLRAELVRHRPADAGPRDRPDIAAAISAPLLHEGRLLGVLNVSVAIGERLLDEDDLATIDRLARRISLILHRFLGIQQASEGQRFQTLDRRLQTGMRGGDPLGAILQGWAAALRESAGSSRLSLALVCEDGSLLAADDQRDAAANLEHVPPANPAWREVLASGRPLVVRETAGEGGRGDAPAGAWTVFYLPVGRPGPQAILTAGFGDAPAAHRFHDLSGEICYLLEKRLPELVSRFIQQDRLERFADLVQTLAEIAAAAARPAEALSLLRDAARRLTGAEEVQLVGSLTGDRPVLIGPGDESPAPAWLSAQATRLLADAAPAGWRSTLIEQPPAAGAQEQQTHAHLTLLAVVAEAGRPAPGLLLRGKRRLHALDGAVFSAFDAELAGRLARLLPTLAAAAAEPQPAVLQIVAGAEEPPAEAPPLAEAAAAQRQELLLSILRREMDRCDRYHTTFSLTAWRPLPPAAWTPAQARRLAETLSAQARSSDYVTWHDCGCLIVLAPEDTQAAPRLARRLGAVLREQGGDSAQALSAAQVLYPGRHDDAGSLLAALLADLPAAG